MTDINALVDLLASADDPAVLAAAITTVADAKRRLVDAQAYYDDAKAALVDVLGGDVRAEPEAPASPAPERMTLAEARAWLRSSSYPVPVGRGSLERCDAMIALITSGGEHDFDAFEPLDWSSYQKAPESPQDASEPPGDTEGAVEASEPAESNQDSQCVIPEPVGVEEQPLLVIPVTTCPECAQPVERCDCVPY